MNRPFLKFVALFCFQIIPFCVDAQYLGQNQGDYVEIASQTGFSGNAFMHKLWLYRKTNGDGWTNATLFDGIGIDGSFLTPGVDVRTWWHRDPGDESQTWGTNNQTHLTLNGKKLGVQQSMLEVQSPNKGWLMSTRTNAFNAGDTNGLRFYSGYLGDEKWAGIASVAEDLHSNNTGLSMYTNQSEKLRITASGDVGIGTTTPKEKLSVNGKIRAHEIKVETANWPDYVFEEGYKVGTLKGLESYIKVNKHLPDMPTAKEIESNGLELGEMVKMQQKKIEELTLHLISLDKKVGTLERENRKLRVKHNKR